MKLFEAQMMANKKKADEFGYNFSTGGTRPDPLQYRSTTIDVLISEAHQQYVMCLSMGDAGKEQAKELDTIRIWLEVARKYGK